MLEVAVAPEDVMRLHGVIVAADDIISLEPLSRITVDPRWPLDSVGPEIVSLVRQRMPLRPSGHVQFVTDFPAAPARTSLTCSLYRDDERLREDGGVLMGLAVITSVRVFLVVATEPLGHLPHTGFPVPSDRRLCTVEQNMSIARPGEKPKVILEVALLHPKDLSEHLSRRVSRVWFDHSDAILVGLCRARLDVEVAS